MRIAHMIMYICIHTWGPSE